MAQKSEKLGMFYGEEKKILIRSHFRLTNLVRRFTQGRRRCGGGGDLAGGRGFSFREADVVPFTFEVN